MVCATVPAFCRANGPPSHLGTSPSADCFVGNRPIACGNTGSGRPVSLSLNTGSWSPYFAFAQYGLLVALFRFRSIRAPSTAMCSGRGPCAHTPPPPTDLSLVWFTVQTQENRSDYQRTKGKNTGNLPSMDLWLQEDCSRTWTYKRPSSAGSRYNS